MRALTVDGSFFSLVTWAYLKISAHIFAFLGGAGRQLISLPCKFMLMLNMNLYFGMKGRKQKAKKPSTELVTDYISSKMDTVEYSSLLSSLPLKSTLAVQCLSTQQPNVKCTSEVFTCFIISLLLLLQNTITLLIGHIKFIKTIVAFLL